MPRSECSTSHLTLESLAEDGQARRFRPAAFRATSMAIVLLVGLAGGALLWRGSAAPPAGWLDPKWTHRRALRTQGLAMTAPLVGFPLRVEYMPTDETFWKTVQQSGADVRFSDSSGQRLLPFEMEEFDRARKRMIAWVRLPELDRTGETGAYVYYGNPLAPPPSGSGPVWPVWDEQYEAVWHMNPRVVRRKGLLTDSTGHSHDAAPSHGPVGVTDGLDRGVAFTGTGGGFGADNSPGWQFGDGDWTIEFWIRRAPLKGRNFELLARRPSFNLYIHNEGFVVLERYNESTHADISFVPPQMSDLTWTAVTVTRTRQYLKLGMNGVYGPAYLSEPGFVEATVSTPLTIGAGPYEPLEGRLAEFRLSRGIARSADWILASFKSEFGPFVQFGATQTRPH